VGHGSGAKGGYYRAGKETGPDGPWNQYDDPVFLAKLDKFLAAFAARYDGKPWLRYLTSAASAIGAKAIPGREVAWSGFAACKKHVDIHLKHFKRSLLVLSDDFRYALSNPSERKELHRHALANGSVIAMTAFSSTVTWKDS
jgi:hypothetical protein